MGPGTARTWTTPWTARGPSCWSAASWACGRSATARFYALNNACPPRQGPLIRGTLEKTAEGSGCFIRCPMHGWRFDLATGDSHGRPGNATVYPLIRQNDELYIEL